MRHSLACSRLFFGGWCILSESTGEWRLYNSCVLLLLRLWERNIDVCPQAWYTTASALRALRKEKGKLMDTFILILSVGLIATFLCVGSPLIAYHIYHLRQGVTTTQRLKSRARLGVMVLTCIALTAALSLVLFTIHPPSSKFAIPFFVWLLLVSDLIFQVTFPLPTPPGRQRLRLFSLWCIFIALGLISFVMIGWLLGFLS
jgi:uncharacterized membrane protein